MFFAEKKRFVSSANIMGFKMLEALHKSLTYKRNNSGPKIDPCGTPQLMFLLLDCLLLS